MAKKFDLAIMNPPYDKNLHLKILEKVIPECDEVVNISPMRWLQDPFASGKKTELQRFESVAKHIKDIDVVDNKIGSDMFGIGIFSNLGIYHISNEETDFNYKNFWKKTRSKEEVEILRKVCFNNVDKLYAHIKSDMNGIIVPISAMAGGRGHNPVYKGYKVIVNGKIGDEHWTDVWNRDPKHTAFRKEKNSEILNIEFNSIKEAENFYDSYKTTFMEYICHISVQQQNIQIKYLPFMSDYSQPWTNKRFCDYFDITGFISDTEAEPNSEWEEIFKTMEKYS